MARKKRRNRKNPLDRKESKFIARQASIWIRSAKNKGDSKVTRAYARGASNAYASALARFGHSSASRKAGWKLKGKSLATNPIKSPREVTIYAKFLPFKLYAIKGNSGFYPRQRFVHSFKSGGRVTGLADGSIRLYPKPGSRLWSFVKQRGR